MIIKWHELQSFILYELNKPEEKPSYPAYWFSLFKVTPKTTVKKAVPSKPWVSSHRFGMGNVFIFAALSGDFFDEKRYRFAF